MRPLDEMLDEVQNRTSASAPQVSGALPDLAGMLDRAQSQRRSFTPNEAQLALMRDVAEREAGPGKDAFDWLSPGDWWNNAAVPLYMRGTQMLSDLTLGGGGQVLGNVGAIQDSIERQTYERLAPMLQEQNVPLQAPQGDNDATAAAKWLLERNADVRSWTGDKVTEYAGENPHFVTDVAGGVGSSIGFMAGGLMAGNAAKAMGKLAQLVAGALAEGGMEALTESGGFLTDAHAQGKYDEGLKIANQDLWANVGLNAGLNLLGGRYNPYLDKIPGFGGFMARLLGEIGEEAFLQEPLQGVIESAAQKTLTNGKGFMENLWGSLQEYPEILQQVAASTAASTALTQAMFGVAGGMQKKLGIRNEELASPRTGSMTQAAPGEGQTQQGATAQAPDLAGMLDRAQRQNNEELASPRTGSMPQAAPGTEQIVPETAQAAPEEARQAQREEIKGQVKQKILGLEHKQYGEAEADAGAELIMRTVENLARMSGRDVNDVAREVASQIVGENGELGISLSPNGENEELAAQEQSGRYPGPAETYRQPPMNPGADLDAQVNVVRIDRSLSDIPFWQRQKVFPTKTRNSILARFKNGIVNKHTGLTVTLSGKGLGHILHTARGLDNVMGEALYQAIPHLDQLVQEAYRVETHGDMKAPSGKTQNEPGDLKQVHRFLVPVDIDGQRHVLMLTAKEFETGKAEVDSVSLYDMKHIKKMSGHPSQPLPQNGVLTGTVGNPDTVSVRDMAQGVKGADGNLYLQTGKRASKPDQTKTPEFKKFFGDWENNPANASKVVDENGEPLVVYHGPEKGGFSEFDTKGKGKTKGSGAFFTSNRQNAEGYAGNGADVYPVYLDIKNPYIVDGQGRMWNNLGEVRIYDNETDSYIYKKPDGTFFMSVDDALDYIDGELGDEYHERYMYEVDEAQTTDEIARMVRAGEYGPGYDGVIFENILDTASTEGMFHDPRKSDIGNVYVVFSPTQIKSAADNAGTFDANDPNIYKQSIGKKGAAALDKATAGRRMEDLNVAREMEKAGKDAKAIRLATGWERGADGKWRFEVMDRWFDEKGFFDDTGLREYRDILLKHKRDTSIHEADEDLHEWRRGKTAEQGFALRDTTLGEIYKSPELYAAYPELESLKVRFDDALPLNMGGKLTVSRNPETGEIRLKEIVVNPKFNRWVMNHDLAMNSFHEVMIHEIQHAVQHLENFFNVNDRETGTEYLSEDKYHRDASEVDARNAQRRHFMMPEERRNTLLAETEDVAREDQIILREAYSGEHRLGESESREEKSPAPDETETEARGFTKFIPEIKDNDGNVIQEAKTVIGILEKGDKSTLPHELGHVYLEYMKRIVTEGNVSEVGAQDWRTLQDWLRIRDIDFSNPLSEKDAKRWRNAQEKFAAGFEKYLATGKAPNSRLKTVFEAFKRWLRDIYGAVKNITYTDADGNERQFRLTDDVRQVMDRMISLNEELEIRDEESIETVEDWEYPELSGDATEAVDGWLEQWERHAIQSEGREAAQDIANRIKEHGGLRYQDFARMLGREGAKEVREKWRGLFRNTTRNAALSLDNLVQELQAEGVNMDEEALVRWLQERDTEAPKKPAPLIEANVDTMNALIDRLGVDGARQYMAERARYLKGLQRNIQERYDLDKTDKQARADLEATYKEQREIRENLKALDRLRNAENPDRELTENEKLGLPEGVSDAAEPEIKPKKRPKQETALPLYEALKRGYQMAERASKEGYRAGKAETAEKLKAEFKEKLERTRAQMRGRQEKHENKLKDFYKGWIGRLRDEKKERVALEKVRGQIKLKNLKDRIRTKQEEKQETSRLLRNITRMAGDARVIWAKQEEIRALVEGRSKTKLKKDLDLAGLRELGEKVKELHKQGREEYQRWLEDKDARITQIWTDLRGALAKRTAEKPMAVRGREDKGKQYKGLTGKAARLKDWTYANTLGRDRFFDWLDGGRTKHDGAFVKNFVDVLGDAYNEGLKHAQKRRDWMEAELKKLGFKVENFSKVAAVIDRIKYTYDQVMEIYMGMKNEKKAQAILYGNFVNEGKYTPEEAQGVIDRLIGTLTEGHKKAAELVAKDHEMNFDRLNGGLIKASNKGMDHETDYTSTHRLEHRSYQGLIDANDEAALMDGMTRAAVMQKVENGFTKRRVEIAPKHQGAIQLGLFSNWMSDVARHEHAAAMMGPAGELMSALMRKGEDGQTIGRMVKDRFGGDAWRALVSFFNDSVNDDMRLVHGVLDDMSRFLARNMAITYLAANPSPMMKQMASLPRFMIAAGPHRLIASVGRFLANRRAFLDRVYELSPQIRDRKGDEMLRALRQDPEWGKRKYQRLLDMASAPIGWVDRATCAVGWDAVYRKNLAALGHDGAAREADRIVRLTQPIANPKDKSRLWRQGGPLRVLMMFTGDANQTWGMTAYDLAQQLGSKEWNGTKDAFVTMTVMTLTAAWIKKMGDWWSNIDKEDDDDDEDRSFLGDALTEQSLLSFPLIGKELATAVQIRQGKYSGWRPSSLSAPVTKLFDAFYNWTSDDEDKQDRALGDAAEALSLLGLAPMPVSGARRLFRMLDGE